MSILCQARFLLSPGRSVGRLGTAIFLFLNPRSPRFEQADVRAVRSPPPSAALPMHLSFGSSPHRRAARVLYAYY
jgi:hypothetical protein